jgi:hypothetical protein
MVKYNHMMDIAFQVETEEPDALEISKEEVLAALMQRIATLFIESHWREAIGHCDTYTIEEGDRQEAAGLDQYDLERCVCTLCDHLDDFEDLDRMANGDFTEDEEAEIWSTFSRDATKEEIAAIKAMIFARYCKFIGKG